MEREYVHAFFFKDLYIRLVLGALADFKLETPQPVLELQCEGV